MPDPQFNELRKQLLGGGVSPRFIQRTVLELREHYCDIERDALEWGATPEEAAAYARRVLGDAQAIADAVLARPELRDWTQQWPRAATCLDTLVAMAVLPVAPVVYCAYRGQSIARWSLSVSLAFLVTAAFLLGLRSLVLV
jgi:hypothetical protein